MSTLSKKFARKVKALRSTGERGLQTVEWIFLIVGILAMAGIVVLAVTAFVNAQIAQLPG